MDINSKARWIEVQTWFICHSLLKKHNNIMDIMSLIEGLAPMGGYPPEPVKLIISEIITSNRFKPSEEEYILLLYKVGVTTRKIKEKTHKSGSRLYSIIKADEKNPRAFYPRLITQQIELLEQFLNIIKEIGDVIPC